MSLLTLLRKKGTSPPAAPYEVGTNASRKLPFQLAAQLGQGPLPRARLLVSFDDLATIELTWVDLTSRLRSFSFSRGRESELTAFDAGSAEVVLDDRDRDLDSTDATSPYYGTIGPMNRIWLLARFSGETHSIFSGYAESWDQTWPGGGFADAEVKVNASDELMRLALGNLPVTSPPRNSYEEVVASDNPTGYWRLNQPAEIQKQEETKLPVNPVKIGRSRYPKILPRGGQFGGGL